MFDVADGRAHSASESVLKGLCDEAGLDVAAQQPLGLDEMECQPDLVDRGRGLVIEAESFLYHGSKKDYRRDIRRYTALSVGGWRVLRFTWWEIMHAPDYVVRMLRTAKRRAERPEAPVDFNIPA